MSDASYKPFFAGGRQSCSSVATCPATDESLPDWGKGADFRQFQRERSSPVATVAAVAGVTGPELPWDEGIQTLLGLPCPAFLDKSRWDELVFDACKLTETWGDTLHALGWTAIDLYGCNPDPRAGRLDRNGVAMFLRGRDVTSVTERSAIIGKGADRHTYRRDFDMSASVPIWVAFSSETGP